MEFNSIERFFQLGGFFMHPILIVLAAGLAIAFRIGFFMYPILIVLAVGLAIAFGRVQLKRVRDANQKMWDQLHPVLAKGEFDKAREMANKDKSSMKCWGWD
jgi:hypothetical protein